ncbi:MULTISPECIES: hypothetical protein [unclassified Oceanobacter]|jgi:hypothetical protein|uniref:hypothetical protein n=1 Tax=unclassified Oceanobacter TaxID=2620260 RepID=UPI002736334D|nr:MULTISPECIES: hypothetical protein [unclassified Oceanobacter]MDP2506790.1 hypothetical protein [Oceanobacter sp. 3_MG-2023]MDP2547901.1 hypothetical protein [Oceanobacter sp. 4_MG-2023]
MKASALMAHWQQEYGDPVAEHHYPVSLNIKDAARVEALLDMFPGLSRERLLADLVQAALNDLTSGFPYVAGNTIVARDEEGFPLYEDIGPTPTFLALSRKHLARMDPGQH